MQLLGPARLPGLVAALAFCLILASSGSALASHVQCGDVITQDTTLDRDLLNCPGDGLVIGADGVRLNLAGHTVDGVDTEVTTGIKSLGFNDLVINNGNVDGFEFGVDLTTSNSTIRDITVTSCCSITVGIGVGGNDNTVVRNVTTNGGGMIGVHGDRNVVSRNLIQSQTDDSYFHVSGTDIRVSHNRIETGCVVCEGLSLGEVHGAVISHNVVTGGGCNCAGISAFSATSTDSRLAHNTVTGMGYGITVSGDFDVFHNTSSFNDYDGIQVSGEGSTLTRNTANFNGELGIYAAPGTLDGGGNRARGNGNPAQCVGVRCK
jgi:hypothetical protein